MEDRFLSCITYVFRVSSALVMNIMDTIKTVEVIYINSASVLGGWLWPYIDGRSVACTVCVWSELVIWPDGSSEPKHAEFLILITIYIVVLLNEHMYACKCVCMYVQYTRVCVHLCMHTRLMYVCAHVTESTLWIYSDRPSRPRLVVQVNISTTIPRFSHPTTRSLQYRGHRKPIIAGEFSRELHFRALKSA